MRSLIFPLCLIATFFAGFRVAKISPKRSILSITETEKPFSVLLYAHNQGPWIEKSLRSIFEQDYENYQVILIDDGSSDNTLEIAQNIIREMNQSAKVFLIQTEEKKGYFSSLQEVIQNLDDQEIVLPLLAKDFLGQNLALKKINGAFCETNVRIAKGKSLVYPSYETSSPEIQAFHASVFKDLSPKTLKKGKPLGSLLKGKTTTTEEILLISNQAATF